MSVIVLAVTLKHDFVLDAFDNKWEKKQFETVLVCYCCLPGRHPFFLVSESRAVSEVCGCGEGGCMCV